VKEFPRSLRPAFPTGLLDFNGFDNVLDDDLLTVTLMERLKERVGLFFEEFLIICKDELGMLNEFHDFLDFSIEVQMKLRNNRI